jgi:hypothetical protein
MKSIMAILFLCLLGIAGQANAGQAEVRNVALLNNCTPKKIEVFEQSLGSGGDTTYRVECTLPKTVAAADNATKPADALLIRCTMNLCEMLRPISLDKK